ncbi:alpha-L-fucosidase [Arcticibacter svalbardensis]
MQRQGWGYTKTEDGKHKTKEEVITMLKKANSYPANLLLNTGPLPSGEMHPEDVKFKLRFRKYAFLKVQKCTFHTL